MEVEVAKHAGGCFGVRRAIETAVKAAHEAPKPVFSLGPLVHNPQIVGKLKDMGIEATETLSNIHRGTVIFRSHGVPPEVEEEVKARGLHWLDATCPYVKKLHLHARELQAQGYQVVIIGERQHPEVTATLAWAEGKAIVVASKEEALQLGEFERLGVVVQTTQSMENFAAIMRVLEAKAKEIKVFNTICHATQERQEAAAELSRRVDLMLVVGGRNSANTRRLAEICRESGTPTYHIETEEELIPGWFRNVNKVGITAGASTPDWIIKEVVDKVKGFETEHNAEDFADAFSQTLRDLSEGEIVEGLVVKVTPEEVLVDLGYKSEGVIKRQELSENPDLSPNEIVKVGDKIDVYVVSVEGREGNLILSKKRADEEKAWEKLEKTFAEQGVVQAKVTGVIKGGLLADIGLVKAFIPASQAAIKYTADLSPLVGQELACRILEIEKGRKKVVLSHRAVLEEIQERQKKAIWENIHEGKVYQGTVTRITGFGAFVDIGGVEGLLHVSEIAWRPLKHPSEVVKEGEKIEVKVLNADPETGRISLTLKQLQPDPWATVAEKFSVGDVITGKVKRTTKFGAFVELLPGVDGLVHISNLSDKRVAKTEDVVKVGDEVRAKIIELNPLERRIGLSIKEVEQDNEKQEYKAFLEQQEETETTIGERLHETLESPTGE